MVEALNAAIRRVTASESYRAFLAGEARFALVLEDDVLLTDRLPAGARRLLRDLQGAVPNSVRITSSGSTQFVEFTPIAASGTIVFSNERP